jgi:hypothetical protein
MAVRSLLRLITKPLFLLCVIAGQSAWSATSTSDSITFERAHRFLYAVSIYDGNSNLISSSIMLAIDNHHFVAPYLSIASTIRRPLKIFAGLSPGGPGTLSEVSLQYIDLFSGTALLYSPGEIKDHIQINDLSSGIPSSGETMKVVATSGNSADGVAAIYTGVVSDDVHEVFTLNSPLSLNTTKPIGCLLLSKEGKIVGIYQGNSYLKSTETFTLSSSFLYLFKKAMTSQVFPTDVRGIQRQLTNQLKALMVRTVASLEKPGFLPAMNLSPWSLRAPSNYLNCEVDSIGNTIKCNPRAPLFVEDNVPAVNVEGTYSRMESSGLSDLIPQVASLSMSSQQHFNDRRLACRQQRTTLAPSLPIEDFQAHFCLSKSTLQDSSYDLFLRGVSIPKNKKSLYFQVLVEGFPVKDTKKISHLLVNLLQRKDL